MIDRNRHEQVKQLYRFRERMHERDWPQAQLRAFEIALYNLKRLHLER